MLRLKEKIRSDDNPCGGAASWVSYLLGMMEYCFMWVLAFRSGHPVHGARTNNYSEANIGVIKNVVFRRKQAINLLHLVMILCTELDEFLQSRVQTKIRGMFGVAAWLREVMPFDADKPQVRSETDLRQAFEFTVVTDGKFSAGKESGLSIARS